MKMKIHVTVWPLALSAFAVALVATTVQPASLRAQGTAVELEAGSRVADIEVTPAAPLRVGMGDTLAVSFDFLDDQGTQVRGFRWGFQFSPPIVGARPDRVRGQGAFEIWGMKPGRSSLQIGVLVTDEDGNPSPEIIEQIEVMIEDWPVAQVEIEPPRFEAYAGTSFQLTARAITTRETIHATARPLWRSETPDVAAVTSTGVVTLLGPGTARLTAGVGGASDEIAFVVVENPVTKVRVSPAAGSVRTGDVLRFEIVALDAAGHPVSDAALSYAVQAIPSAPTPGATIYEDGVF
ncbi:MAG: hypothetical protein P8Y07_04705, partial [Gemmatimonadales bacterium]